MRREILGVTAIAAMCVLVGCGSTEQNIAVEVVQGLPDSVTERPVTIVSMLEGESSRFELR